MEGRGRIVVFHLLSVHAAARFPYSFDLVLIEHFTQRLKLVLFFFFVILRILDWNFSFSSKHTLQSWQVRTFLGKTADVNLRSDKVPDLPLVVHQWSLSKLSVSNRNMGYKWLKADARFCPILAELGTLTIISKFMKVDPSRL